MADKAPKRTCWVCYIEVVVFVGFNPQWYAYLNNMHCI
jgi:hypothetical protein